MAQKRMFSLQVVDTDKFTDMPTSAQALYFHLGMHGDDDGFVASPRKIARTVGCNCDDIAILAAKGFIIPFDSGVVVITDWKINNTLKNDRYRGTIYQAEKAMLHAETSGKYLLGPSVDPECFQSGTNTDPQRNVTQYNVTEPSITEGNRVAEPPKPAHISPPSVDDVRTYCGNQGYTTVDPERFVSYYAARQWMAGQTAITDWRAAVDSWHRKDVSNQNGKTEYKPSWTIGTVV